MKTFTRLTSGLPRWHSLRVPLQAFALLLLCSVAFRPAYAQVAYNYNFSQTAGTYTPITGATSLYTGTFDDATSAVQTIPSFTFDGVTYTSMYVNTNGWLTLGTDPGTNSNYTPLSSSTPGRCISPFGNDLNQATSGTPSVSWGIVGTEIVVQWQDVRRYSSQSIHTEKLSFQARMDTVSGIVKFVYSDVHGINGSTSYPQIGLRGLDNTFPANVNIRSLANANPWTATTAGTSNGATVAFDTTNGTVPTSGLTFVYTPAPCLTLSSTFITNLTTGGATVNWAAPSTAPLGYIYVVVPTGVSVDSTPSASGIVPGTDSSVVISGLAGATLYDVYVKKVCSATDSSAWTGPSTFTTLCVPLATYPYLQSFSSSLPICWSVSHGASSDPDWSVTTADASHGVSAPEAGPDFLHLDVYNAHTAGNPYNVTTGSFILTGAAKQITYYYFLGNSGSSTPLTVNISTDAGATWTPIYSHTHANSTFGTSNSTTFWTPNTIDLTSYIGDTVQFQFSATSNWGSGVCNMGIDEFLINNAPTCYPVSGIATTSVGGDRATFTWTAPALGAPNDYNWQIRTSGIPDSTVTGIVATGNTLGTTDSSTTLSPLTTYQLWVQTDCGPTDGNSTWRGPVTFTTTTLPCSGTPTAGSASLVSAGVCSAIVGLTGSSYGLTGLSYQWQQRFPAGSGAFTNVPGANATDTMTLPGAVSDFRCVVTCTASGSSDTSSVVTVTAAPGEAAAFSPLAVTGFNQDVIANGNNNHAANPPALTTTTTVDAPNGYYFYDASYSFNGTTYPATSLPVNGQVVSNSITGLLYQLQSATTSNVLQLRGGTQLTGTLTAVTPQSGTEVYLLGVSGNGASTITAVVHFTDGSSQTFTGLTVKDWFNGTPYSQGGFGRVSSTGFDGGAPGGNNPRMYDIPLPLAPANYAKLVQSVTVTNTTSGAVAGSYIVNIFGVTIATPTPASFCGGLATSVSLFNAASSGVTYQWQSSATSGGPYTDVATGTGATTTTYTNTSTGSIYYVVEATCTASGLTALSNEVNVNINPAVNVNVTPATVNFCSNDTGVVLTAHTSGSGITYAWSPTQGLGSTTDSAVLAHPTATTTYTVTAINSGGCTSTASAVVNYVAAPSITSITSTPTELCAGATAQLNVVADTTGQPALTYAWSPGGTLSRTDTSSTVASPPAGNTTYTVTVSNGICAATASVTDTVGATLAMAPTATTTATGVYCARQTTFHLAANRTGGGGPFTYAWTSAAGFMSAVSDTSVTPDTTTTYYLTVTDNCGSSVSDSVLVTVVPTPYVSVNPTAATFCAGGTPVSLTASGASTLSWSPSAGLDVTTGATVNASPTTSTSYVVTGTTGGCSATATSVVTLASPPAISLVTALPSAPTICQGYHSQLDVVAATPVGAYCVPTISSTFLHYLRSFYLTDTTGTTTYVSTTRASAAGTANNYVDHGTAATTGTLAADSTYDFNGLYGGAYEGLAVWIDFNQNGIFDNTELLYAHYAGSATGGAPFNGSFTIPPTALSGTTKMRVRIGWGSDTIPDANGLYSCTPGNSDGFSTYGSTDDYTITITGGVTPSGLVYAWSPSGSLDNASIHNPIATPANTTEYTVTVTDPNTGCSSTHTDSVYIYAPIPLATSISGPTGTVCGATHYVLTSTTIGGCTPYTYAWSDGSGTLVASTDSILPTATTTYTVTVTDSSGTQVTSSFTLNVVNPLITSTDSASLCGSGAVTLVATPSAGATILWYDSLINGNLVHTGDTFNTASLTSSVTYYAYATTSSPACSSAASAVVASVHANPALTLNFNIVHACAGTNAQLAITSTLPATASYTWAPTAGLYTDAAGTTAYTGGNAASVYGLPTATTAYTVTLYDSSTGCSSHQTDSFIVYQRPTAQIIGADTSICQGAVLSGTIVFTGTGPWTFTRTTDQGLPVTATTSSSPYAYSDTPTVSGPIKVTLLGDAHCVARYSDLDSLNVTVYQISASFTSSATTAHKGDNVTFTDHSTGAVSYSWDFGDGSTSTTQSPSHTYSAIGIYTVSLTVTNSHGCTATTSRQDTVIPPLAITDIPSDNSMLKIFSYENKVMVDFSQYKAVDATIRIYNVIGQELSNETHHAPTTYIKTLSNAEAAYVVVSVKMSDGSVISKKLFVTN